MDRKSLKLPKLSTSYNEALLAARSHSLSLLKTKKVAQNHFEIKPLVIKQKGEKILLVNNKVRTRSFVGLSVLKIVCHAANIWVVEQRFCPLGRIGETLRDAFLLGSTSRSLFTIRRLYFINHIHYLSHLLYCYNELVTTLPMAFLPQFTMILEKDHLDVLRIGYSKLLVRCTSNKVLSLCYYQRFSTLLKPDEKMIAHIERDHNIKRDKKPKVITVSQLGCH